MNCSLFKTLGILTLTLFFTACSDDDYSSTPPMINNMTVRSLTTGDSEVHVGERFVVTVEQQKKGSLLNLTQYRWSSSGNNISHKFQQSVIYDQENQNPTDTIIVSDPGYYKIIFTGKYNASGSTSEWSDKYGSTFIHPFDDKNGKVTYTTGGILYFNVVAEKNIKVLP